MLPKKHRLNLTKRRFNRGDSQVSAKYFKIIVKRGRSDGPKVGFIVNSKVGNAVTRNRVIRSLSAAVESSVANIPKDTYLIFIAHPQVASVEPSEIKISVNRALVKI